MVNENECPTFIPVHMQITVTSSSLFGQIFLLFSCSSAKRQSRCPRYAPSLQLFYQLFHDNVLQDILRLTNESGHTRVMQQRGLDAYKQATVNVTADLWLTLTHKQTGRVSQNCCVTSVSQTHCLHVLRMLLKPE